MCSSVFMIKLINCWEFCNTNSEFGVISTGKNFLKMILVPEEMRPITDSWNQWNNEIRQSTVGNAGWKWWFTLFERTSIFPPCSVAFQDGICGHFTSQIQFLVSYINDLQIIDTLFVMDTSLDGALTIWVAATGFTSPNSPQSLHFCGYGHVFLYAIYKMCLLWLLLIMWSFIHFPFFSHWIQKSSWLLGTQ